MKDLLLHAIFTNDREMHAKVHTILVIGSVSLFYIFRGEAVSCRALKGQ